MAISPFLKINERIKEHLEDKNRLKIDVRVIADCRSKRRDSGDGFQGQFRRGQQGTFGAQESEADSGETEEWFLYIGYSHYFTPNRGNWSKE